MKNKNWIQDAIKKPGSFTNQAKRADMGTQEFAGNVLANKDKYNKKTEQRAALARRLNSMH